MTGYNGATYTWMGRELRKITSGSNTYSYKYNADGIRTFKTVNGTTTEFFLQRQPGPGAKINPDDFSSGFISLLGGT